MKKLFAIVIIAIVAIIAATILANHSGQDEFTITDEHTAVTVKYVTDSDTSFWLDDYSVYWYKD